MIELHDIKTAIDLADQLPDTQDSFRISTTLMACGNEIESLRAENKALHTKLAQFTKWNSQLTAKCNWYNCDGARLEREIEALKQQVEQGKRDAERYLATLVISNEAIRQFRNEDMLARLIKLRGTQGYCQLVSAFDIGRDVIEAAIAEAPK